MCKLEEIMNYFTIGGGGLVNGVILTNEIIEVTPNFDKSGDMNYYDNEETEAYVVEDYFSSDDEDIFDYTSKITAKTDKEFEEQLLALTKQEVDRGRLVGLYIPLDIQEYESRMAKLPCEFNVVALPYKENNEYYIRFLLEDNNDNVMITSNARSELLEKLVLTEKDKIIALHKYSKTS